MNETLRIEKAYYEALGITTHYVAEEGNEWLASDETNKHVPNIIGRRDAVLDLMLTHEINIEFTKGHVLAYHGRERITWQPYGDAQWQTKAWALGMAVVRAATEKFLREKV